MKPGEDLPEGSRSVQALVWVESEVAPQLKAGLPATIELGLASGTADTLDGEVTTVAALPLSAGLPALKSAAPVSVYRLDIALDKALTLFPCRRECRIVIELGRQSPVALFGMRRS